MPVMQSLDALEILDSRGRPTVQAYCTLATGHIGVASVPSGASTGAAEALELRDGDRSRYRGFGVLRAVDHVRITIAHALIGRDYADQHALDHALIELDGTPDKARLGANAILAVSLAFARAFAAARQQPLFRYFADFESSLTPSLPRLTINLFSGGKHAGGQVAIQDVLIVPHADTVHQSLAHAFAVYQAAADIIREKYAMRALTADEGGLAPPFPHHHAMIDDALAAITRAGLRPGDEMALALDVAASHFYSSGMYSIDGMLLDTDAMIHVLLDWAARFPFVSIEDGLSEEDWSGWEHLTERLPVSTRALGDDLLCTNPARIQRAIRQRAANALLLKVNQIGTLSEAFTARTLAHQAGWHIVVSARSGETEDDWLADLAVGWSADWIKVGSITQSERLAKYNRLLALEARHGISMKSATKG